MAIFSGPLQLNLALNQAWNQDRVPAVSLTAGHLINQIGVNLFQEAVTIRSSLRKLPGGWQKAAKEAAGAARSWKDVAAATSSWQEAAEIARSWQGAAGTAHSWQEAAETAHS